MNSAHTSTRNLSRAVRIALVALVAFVPACQEPPPDPVSLAIDVAMEYVDGYYKQFPEEAYEVGYPDTPLDRLGDRSRTAMADWDAREDAWLSQLESIEPASLEGTDAAVPYAFARWRLEASRDRRVCRVDLWNASPTWSGWQSIIPSTLSQQPVGTDAARADALARARDIPRYLDTEIANLREGVALGFTAPRNNVEAVIRQMDGILETSAEASPFYSPAERDSSKSFADRISRSAHR